MTSRALRKMATSSNLGFQVVSGSSFLSTPNWQVCSTKTKASLNILCYRCYERPCGRLNCYLGTNQSSSPWFKFDIKCYSSRPRLTSVWRLTLLPPSSCPIQCFSILIFAIPILYFILYAARILQMHCPLRRTDFTCAYVHHSRASTMPQDINS